MSFLLCWTLLDHDLAWRCLSTPVLDFGPDTCRRWLLPTGRGPRARLAPPPTVPVASSERTALKFSVARFARYSVQSTPGARQSIVCYASPRISWRCRIMFRYILWCCPAHVGSNEMFWQVFFVDQPLVTSF